MRKTEYIAKFGEEAYEELKKKRRAYAALQREKNRDKIYEYHKNWTAENRDKVSSYYEKYEKKNKDAILKRSSDWYKEN